MCSHPDCKERLVLDAPEDQPVTVGEAAHIVARAGSGPRGDRTWTPARLNSYDNLILLCASHHTLIDRQPQTYSVDHIRTWKAEHEAWVRASTAHLPDPIPWTAIFHEDPARRIDTADAAAALGAGHHAPRTLALHADVSRLGWGAAAAAEARALESDVSTTPPEQCRFAVFSLGRIPLAVQLGYILGDRARVALYHYHRDRGSWQWPSARSGPSLDLRESPRRRTGSAPSASLRVSLSARVSRESVAPAAVDIEIAPPAPSVFWLRSPGQLTELARMYEQALARIRERGCRRVHLYYAGPAAGAIAFGRAYNPRMNPSLELYEYAHGGRPCYEPVLTLNRS
jgi:hypothetical protein